MGTKPPPQALAAEKEKETARTLRHAEGQTRSHLLHPRLFEFLAELLRSKRQVVWVEGSAEAFGNVLCIGVPVDVRAA